MPLRSSAFLTLVCPGTFLRFIWLYLIVLPRPQKILSDYFARYHQCFTVIMLTANKTGE